MRTKNKIRVLITLILITVPSYALTMKFINENSAFSSNEVYVLFTEAAAPANPFDAINNGQPMSTTTSYSFAELSNGITLNHVDGGVFYVSLGKPMTSNRTDAPSFTNTSDPDYYTRWDKFEITFNGNPADVANLTGINSFAVPISIKTYGNGGTTQRDSLGYSIYTDEMINLLAAEATNNSAVLKDASNSFLRVIGPTTYPAGTLGPYPPFDDYVNSTITSGDPILIQGQFSRGGVTPSTTNQIYTFTNTFDAGGNLMMNGGGTAVGMNHTVVISNDVLAYNIYANNPAYYVDGTQSSFAANDVYSAAVRDTIAGFAIGYVGSPVIDPVTGIAFKDEFSKHWYETNQPLAFSDVQPSNEYYNGYAEVFWKYSDSYGFPFSDKLHKPVQISLNPANVDTIEIIVLPDVPEPCSFIICNLLFIICLRDRVIIEFLLLRNSRSK